MTGPLEEFHQIPKPIVPQPSTVPYIVAIIFGVLIAALLIVVILYLRPNIDPFNLITAIGTVSVIITGQAVNFIKAAQHDEQSRVIGSSVIYRVDGAMEKLLAERAAREKAQGLLEGVAQEQARIVAKELAETLAHSVPAAIAAVAPIPIPVTIVKDLTKQSEEIKQ